MVKIEGEQGDKYKWLIAKLKKDLCITTTKEVHTLLFNAFCDLLEYDELAAHIRDSTMKKEVKRKCAVCGGVWWASDFLSASDVCIFCADKLDLDNPYANRSDE